MSSFECRKCANCCSNFLPLLPSEINLMKRLKGKENIQVLNQNWYTICPFLNSNNRCDIYENRPIICREYTCYKAEKGIYNKELFSKYKEGDFKFTDIRKEIFNRNE